MRDISSWFGFCTIHCKT